MKKSLRKAISLVLSVAMIIAVAAVSAFALPATANCTEPIAITPDTESVDNLSSNGWKWDKATNTLTIKDMYQKLADNVHNSIDFSESDADINIVVQGENKFEFNDSAFFEIKAKGIVTVNGEGTMNIVNSYNSASLGISISGAEKTYINNVTINNTDLNSTTMFFGALNVWGCDNIILNNVTVTENGNNGIVSFICDDPDESSCTVTGCNFSTSNATLAVMAMNIGKLTFDNSVISGEDFSLASIITFRVDEVNFINSDINTTSDLWGCMFDDGTVNITNSKFSSKCTFDAENPDEMNGDLGGIILNDADLYVKDSVVSASGNCGGIISVRNNYAPYIASLNPETQQDKINIYKDINTDHSFTNPVISFENSDLTVSCAEGFLPVMFTFGMYNSSDEFEDDDFNIEDYTLNPVLIFKNMKGITSGAMSASGLLCIEKAIYVPEEGATANNNMAIYGITATGAAPTFNYTTHTFTNGAVLAQFLSKGVFELNGGTLAESSMVSGSVINKTAGTPVKKGYTFGGWYYDKELTKPVKDGDTYTAGMVLYAKWIAATGDNTEIGAIAAIGVFSILGMGLVIKKRK